MPGPFMAEILKKVIRGGVAPLGHWGSLQKCKFPNPILKDSEYVWDHLKRTQRPREPAFFFKQTYSASLENHCA